MLKLEEKEYDLNFLFQFSFDFQMLKEILIKLAKTNKDLESRIKKLEKSNKEKGKHISFIEDKLNIEYIPDKKTDLSSGEDEDLNDKNNDKDFENSEKDDNAFDDKEIENESNKSEFLDKKDKNKDSGFQDKGEKDEKDKNKEDSDEGKIMKNFRRERSYSIKMTRKDYESISSYLLKPPVTSEAIKQLLKLIKDNTDRIKKVDRNLNYKITNSYNKLKKDLNNLDNQNTEEHKIINEKIADLNRRLYDYNDKMDGLVIKTAGLDNLSIFKDNGDGTVDASKVMIKMVEERINKKIEIIEKKNNSGGVDGGNYSDLKRKMDLLQSLINKLNKEFEVLKENRDISEKKFEDKIKELKNLIDKKNDDLLKLIEELSEKIKDGEFSGDKLDDLLKKLKTEDDKKSDLNNETDNNKNDGNENLQINIKLLELKERIKELNKKINEKDNYYKNLLNQQGQDIGEIKRKIDEMSNKLEKKITRDDLKELYNHISEHSDNLKYLEDIISELNEGYRKLLDNNTTYVKRLENLIHDVIELKERDFKGSDSRPIDMTKYIDENKLKEILKPIKKNIDILMTEKDSLYNRIENFEEKVKLLETKERVNKLEEELNDRINDLINKLIKKYVERSEFNKAIKNLDLQIKMLDNQHNKDADSWILAKQPLGCFNCASCEANIKNAFPSNEYLPWNKYPQGERQYHVGQGFSRLLQRISNDSAYRNFNYERKEISSDNEINNNLYNSMSNMKGNNFVFKINNRETMKEDFNESNIKPTKKYKLPFVHTTKKRNNSIDNLPLTDEENEKEQIDNNNNNSYDNSNSPKIVRITKKRINELNGPFIANAKQSSVVIESFGKSRMNSTTLKNKSKLERVKSMPIYENV